MKVLVTGGAGFIGSHLVDSLLADGREVVVLDDFSTGRRENLAHVSSSDRLTIVEGTILDEELVKKLVRESSEVYHLAAAVGVHRILDEPLESIETNLRGTENVLYAVEGKTRVMIASTSEVYGKNASDFLCEEDDSIVGATSKSRWLYATSKAMDEFLSLAHYRERGTQAVIIRFFNTVGPRQTGMYGMVLPSFVKKALAGEPITIYGNGRQQRNFTYVGDAIRGIRHLMETPEAAGNVYNMGGSEEVSIEQLAIQVRQLTGSNSPLQYVPYSYAYSSGFEDMQRRSPNTDKLKAAIGFTPETPLDDIIQSVIRYYREKQQIAATVA